MNIRRAPLAVLPLLALAAAPAVAKKPKPAAAPPPLETVAADLIGRALVSDAAYEDLVYLCDRIGARFNGSPQLAEALAWGERRFREEGLTNVVQEPVDLPGWSRGEAEASLVAPRAYELHPLALGGSASGEVEAEVVVVGSFDELAGLGEAVKGKIVVYDVPFTTYGETVAYRFAGASAASRLGAVGVLVRSVTPESLDTPHTGSMRYDTDVTPIPALAVTVEDAEMLRRLYERDAKPRVRLRSTAAETAPVPSANVLAEVRGRSKPDEIVVLGCHIDSWDVGTGAQDDGAGCVTVMHAAFLIDELEIKPARTIRVVLYTGEEYGVSGGRGYAAAHAEELPKHFAAVEADTGSGQPLGFGVDVRVLPAAGGVWDVDPDSEAASRTTAQELAYIEPLLATVGAGDIAPGHSGADIGHVVIQGVPGFGVNHDTTDYWPIHHTEADTVDKVDPQLLKRNVAAMAVFAYALAEHDGSLRAPPRAAPADAADGKAP